MNTWRTTPGMRCHAAASGAPSSSSRKSADHSVVGTSTNPPSRPRSGRRRVSTLPSLRTATYAAPRRNSPVDFAPLRGNVSASPRARAAQDSFHGHSAQAGRFGVQIVAPRSIIACAKSPARRSGVSAFGKLADARLRRRQRFFNGVEPRHDAFDVAIDRRRAPIERNRRDGSCGVWADARQFAQSILGVGKVSAVRLRDRLCASVQVARAGVVAEPRPKLENIVEACCRKRLDGRKAGQKSFEIWSDGFDRRLLQHDFGQPDAVRIAFLPVRRAPRQLAAVAIVPGEQRRGGRRRRLRLRRAFACSCRLLPCHCAIPVAERHCMNKSLRSNARDACPT